MSTGFCVRCKSKKELKNEQRTKSKNGRNMLKGNCSTCNGKISVFTK